MMASPNGGSTSDEVCGTKSSGVWCGAKHVQQSPAHCLNDSAREGQEVEKSCPQSKQAEAMRGMRED